ncbi:hypothetical protein MTO96_034543 [Rhipicephalus appendiculatus]
MTFKGVILHRGRKCNRIINPTQFYQSLADNTRARVLTTQSSRVSSSGTVQQNVASYKQLIDDIKVLNPSSWPDDLNVLYGEDEVRRLAKRLRVHENNAVQGLREYIENGGKNVPCLLEPVVTATKCIPVSTADCERGFSAMNNIMTPSRSSLSVERLSKLLFIKTNGPPLQRFRPDSYVNSWLLSGRHSALDVRAPLRKPNEWKQEQEDFWKIF